MLFELYKANAAKAPKNQQQVLPLSKPGQTSPTSAETEPSKVAAIATNGAAADNLNEAASKNLQGDEMAVSNTNGERAAVMGSSLQAPAQAPFHPRIKFSNVSKQTTAALGVSSANVTAEPKTSLPIITAIPTSVLVSTQQEPLDVKPLIHPTTGLVIEPTSAAASVIQPAPSNASVVPQAAAIAAALLRDGYHNFQQQLRAQEILKLNQVGAAAAAAAAAAQPTTTDAQPTASVSGTHVTPTKLFENFLRQQRAEQQQRRSECEHNDSSTDTNDGDDEEEDSRYNGFDDIHLIEGSKTATFNNNGGQHNIFPSNAPQPSDYMSDESQKFMIAAQAHAFRNLEYSMSDYGGNSPGEGEPTYECRHCGKKYRWKSTLRRHENVECGGKEPMHQCPYCPYKSKQRGNLGVHVRKHHSNLPQLASKRRSKYSVKLEGSVSVGGEPSSANVSDDSSSKLMIDCSK